MSDLNAELGGSSFGPEKDPNAEKINAIRHRSRQESVGEALLRNAVTPFDVYSALRDEVLPSIESGHKPGMLTESYRPPNQLTVIDSRARDLKHSIEELKNDGRLVKYDPSSGLGEFENEDLAGYAISTTYKTQLNPKTGFEENVPFHYIGKTETERAELAKAYENAGLELEARAISNELVGIFLNLNARDALEKLVEWMHGSPAKFKPEHLKALLNAPDLQELKDHPEKTNTKFGDQIEQSMFLYAVMLHSGSRKEMESFLSRPGSSELIKKISGATNDPADTKEAEWRDKYIGKIEEWNENPTDIMDYTKEPRGLLTRYGNIAAFKGVNNKSFSRGRERDFIEDVVGTAVGSKEASWVGVSLLKAIGTFSARGHTILPNMSAAATLGEGRFIEPTDTQKFLPLLWNLREGLKKRTFGLNDMLGKIPDMSFDLFDWAGVEVVTEEGEILYRSIWDAWLGTEDQVKRDIRTMEPSKIENITQITNDKKVGDIDDIEMEVEVEVEDPITKTKTKKHEQRKAYGEVAEEVDLETKTKKLVVIERVREEGYHRLGDLNFDSLPSDFHGVCNTIQWLAGREGGVLPTAVDVIVDPKKITTYDAQKFWKYVTIVLNPVVLAKGSMHKFSFGGNGKIKNIVYDLSEDGVGTIVLPSVDGEAHTEVQNTFFNNLILARLKSDSFILEFADAKVNIPDIDGRGANAITKVPLHYFQRAIVELMNRPPPKTLDELRNWRLDLMGMRSHQSEKYSETIKYLESLVNGKGVGPVSGVNKWNK